MRISDWSSDVCSSDLDAADAGIAPDGGDGTDEAHAADVLVNCGKTAIGLSPEHGAGPASRACGPAFCGCRRGRCRPCARRCPAPPPASLPSAVCPAGGRAAADRKSVVQGKSVYVRVDLGGGGMIQITRKKKQKKR